jgi:hypothetical protein
MKGTRRQGKQKYRRKWKSRDRKEQKHKGYREGRSCWPKRNTPIMCSHKLLFNMSLSTYPRAAWQSHTRPGRLFSLSPTCVTDWPIRREMSCFPCGLTKANGPKMLLPVAIICSLHLRLYFCFLKPHFICNLYVYIQQIGVRIGCYGLGKGSH